MPFMICKESQETKTNIAQVKYILCAHTSLNFTYLKLSLNEQIWLVVVKIACSNYMEETLFANT